MINYFPETETTYFDNKKQIIPEMASKVNVFYTTFVKLYPSFQSSKSKKVCMSSLFLFKQVNSLTLKKMHSNKNAKGIIWVIRSPHKKKKNKIESVPILQCQVVT